MLHHDGDFSPAAEYLLEQWPVILKAWGFTKTAGRIHALLLARPEALTADEIMGDLNISRGSTSIQLAQLHSTGLITRLKILGDRHEKFTAIRDAEAVESALTQHLHKQTIQPLSDMSNTLSAISGKSDLHWLDTIQGLGTLLR